MEYPVASCIKTIFDPNDDLVYEPLSSARDKT